MVAMKTRLIVITLVLLAAVAVFSLRRDRQRADLFEEIAGGGTAGGPVFRVHIAVPPSGRAFFGMLPNWLEDRIEGAAPRELAFDQTSPGAEVAGLRGDRIWLRNGDGWDLLIEAGAEGGLAAQTDVVFPIYLGERHVKLRCRPAEPAIGHLRMEPAGEGRLGGSFQVELETCKNADSGKNVAWPPAPLEVRGRFAGLPAAGP